MPVKKTVYTTTFEAQVNAICNWRAGASQPSGTNGAEFLYRLYDGGAWSTGVASFDGAQGHSPSGLSKLKPRVCNQQTTSQSHRITCLYDDIRR